MGTALLQYHSIVLALLQIFIFIIFQDRFFGEVFKTLQRLTPTTRLTSIICLGKRQQALQLPDKSFHQMIKVVGGGEESRNSVIEENSGTEGDYWGGEGKSMVPLQGKLFFEIMTFGDE